MTTRLDSLLLCVLLAVAIIWASLGIRDALVKVSDHSTHAIAASTTAGYIPR
jgi:hypothetical protein